jgi:hypothetical protein
MLKVTITKPGKKIVFNGQVLTTPCKVFIFEKDQTAMKVILMQAGINEKFYSIEKSEVQPLRVETNAKVAKEVAKEAEKIAAEVKGEEVKVEEPKQEAPKAEGKKGKKK